jgi:hypothetical protein
MAHFSDYVESGILNYLFRSNTNNFPRPLNISIALCSGIPQDSNTGATIPEIPNAGGYARANLGAPSDSIFSEISQAHGAFSSGLISNLGTISFPQATADWGWVSGIAIVGSSAYGAGSLLMWAPVGTPRDIKLNDTVSYAAGNLKIYTG